MNERVTKEVAIALKDIGYDVPCDAYYLKDDAIHIGRQEKKDFNNSVFHISAPTVYEAIEWLDSKGVYVEAKISLRYEWNYTIWVKHHGFECTTCYTYPNRLAAYTAGLSIAIDYIKNK